MFTGRYIASSPKHPWVPPTPPDLHCHHILIRRKGVEWSSQPPESRMVATSLTFLLLLLLHLASPAPAPTAEVKEVHSPALGEIVQVCKTHNFLSSQSSQVVPPPTQAGSKGETKRAALLLDKIMFAVQKVKVAATFIQM